MKKLHVLLVEDSPTQAREIAARIRDQEMDVTVVGDGITALTTIRDKMPDLIVLDVNLPGGIDGFQVCRRIKRDSLVSHIPIVMLTSADNADDTLTGIEAGADDYIPKDAFASDNLTVTLNDLRAQILEEGI